MRGGTAWALAACLTLAACQRPGSASKPEVTVAAAANLMEVFGELGPQFEQETGIHPVISFGSTAQLARQIENAAPFDIILGADAQHVEELERKGLLVAGSRKLYATGVLAMWIPPQSRAGISRVEEVASPGVRVIAVAKPELAPYGQATVEALGRLGLWENVKFRVVYAENISMAKQYGTSRNADVVFTALSLVRDSPGRVIRVTEELHQPIRQEAGIVARAAHLEAARRFMTYLLGGRGRDVLRRFGYSTPFGTRSVQQGK